MKETQVGMLFSNQIVSYTNPHDFEGLVYEGADDFFMFCQIGYAKFDMISLKSGNRVSRNGIQMKCDDCSNGIAPEQVLRKVSGSCEESLVCRGTIQEWLDSMVER